MKYLFLDIDGVLNTGQYSNYLVDNGLCETDQTVTCLTLRP